MHRSHLCMNTLLAAGGLELRFQEFDVVYNLIFIMIPRFQVHAFCSCAAFCSKSIFVGIRKHQPLFSDFWNNTANAFLPRRLDFYVALILSAFVISAYTQINRSFETAQGYICNPSFYNQIVLFILLLVNWW